MVRKNRQMADIASLIIAAMRAHGAIHDAYLVGSRKTGNAGPLSDWDFRVDTDDLGRVQRDLPLIVSTLAPLAQQWDRLSDRQCYMLILPGAVKVDLIFDVPNVKASPWHVTASSLPGMGLHFWEWIVWLASKVMAGRDELVRSELAKLYDHLLAPMNAEPAKRGVGAPSACDFALGASLCSSIRN
jgi:predicted nucleotidyltransferase